MLAFPPPWWLMNMDTYGSNVGLGVMPSQEGEHGEQVVVYFSRSSAIQRGFILEYHHSHAFTIPPSPGFSSLRNQSGSWPGDQRHYRTTTLEIRCWAAETPVVRELRTWTTITPTTTKEVQGPFLFLPLAALELPCGLRTISPSGLRRMLIRKLPQPGL